jgi:transcriptional regulator with XRE-family HTH domain
MSLFADRLRLLREKNGWAQRELARRCNIGESMIQKYEKDISEPTASNLANLAEQLGVSIDYLLGRTDDPHEHVGNSQLTDEEREVIEVLRREGWAGIGHLSLDKLAK